MAIEYLFDVTTQPKTKVKDTNFTEYYPSVNDDMLWKSLKGYLETALQTYILPYIGQDFWDFLLANEVSGTPNEDAQKVADLLRYSLSKFAINIAVPELNIIISDGGAKQSSSDGASPPSQWSFRSLRWNLILQAEKMLDSALKIMHEIQFVSWISSAEYSYASTTWYKSMQDFAKYNQLDSIRAWSTLKPYIVKAEDLVKDMLNDQYDDIVSKLSGSPNTYEAALIELIRKYISEMAINLAIPHMLIYKEGKSLVILTSADGVEPGYGVYSRPNEIAIANLQTRTETDAGLSMTRIVDYINKNIDEFPVHKQYMEDTEYAQQTVISSDDCIGGIII